MREFSPLEASAGQTKNVALGDLISRCLSTARHAQHHRHGGRDVEQAAEHHWDCRRSAPHSGHAPVLPPTRCKVGRRSLLVNVRRGVVIDHRRVGAADKAFRCIIPGMAGTYADRHRYHHFNSFPRQYKRPITDFLPQSFPYWCRQFLIGFRHGNHELFTTDASGSINSSHRGAHHVWQSRATPRRPSDDRRCH